MSLSIDSKSEAYFVESNPPLILVHVPLKNFLRAFSSIFPSGPIQDG